jgi:hypothetical protein
MANHGAKYLREATQVFLSNSSFKTPIEAVEAGAKNVAQWCECLNRVRGAYGLVESSVGGSREVRNAAFESENLT